MRTGFFFFAFREMNRQMDTTRKMEWTGRTSNPDTSKWKRLGNTIPSNLNRTIKKKVKRTLKKSTLHRGAKFRYDYIRRELAEIAEDMEYLKSRRAELLKEKADVQAILHREEEGSRHINSSKNKGLRDELIKEFEAVEEPDAKVRELTEMFGIGLE
jgi:hypothetical protein